MSAQESRRKKKDYVDSLEKQYVILSKTSVNVELKGCDVLCPYFFYCRLYTVESLSILFGWFIVILGLHLKK